MTLCCTAVCGRADAGRFCLRWGYCGGGGAIRLPGGQVAGVFVGGVGDLVFAVACFLAGAAAAWFWGVELCGGFWLQADLGFAWSGPGSKALSC